MLEAALDNGLDLPYFCWHPAMGSVGACRLCAVRVYKDENDAKGKIMMACMTPAKDGTRISMNDPEAVEFRRFVIEWLMTNHPHDCPVCDEGGECHLQDMTAMCGQVYRRFRFKKRTYNNQYLGPLVNHEMNRCIQCYRCVRFYKDLAGGRDFDYFGSRNRIYFGRHEDGALESEFSGNLAEVCPTGVFTDKTSDRHYTRKWDLQTAPSVCIHCGLGCNTIPGERYKMLRRVTARFNGDVNGYWLCDRGRYGYEFTNCGSRIADCGLKGRDTVSWTKATNRAGEMIRGAKRVIGIGSPRASLEANYALKKLVGDDNFSTGLCVADQEGIDLALDILRNGPARTPSLAEIEQADVIVVLGIDPTNEAPMLDFAIRQAMRKAPLDIARKLAIPDWDANAVATALQGAKGKLYIAAPWAIKLEEICLEAHHTSPPGIASLAAEIVRHIGSEVESRDSMAARAAVDLREAHQPLVITSISAGADVIRTAASLASALCSREKDCWLTVAVPEANTMGVGMLGGMSVQEALSRVNSGKADTLIVLENDLVRRTGPAHFEAAMKNVKHLIALDCIETATTRAADVVLPTPTLFETDGTFVNNEARAQRFYQVFVPEHDYKPAWATIQEIANGADWSTHEDVLKDLATQVPAFAPALEAAPFADWRSNADQKIARMPHRFSGRTAMDANRTVFEPRPPADHATPLAFSMEGDQNPPESALIPRFWWPGWNSEQSINKFQIEVGGALHGGNPGKRLIEPPSSSPQPSPQGKGAAPNPQPLTPDSQVWIIPHPRIFGSDELSRLAEGIAELIQKVEIVIHPDLASRLKIVEGRDIELEIGGVLQNLTPRFDERIAPDVISVPTNFDETMGILGPTVIKISGAK